MITVEAGVFSRSTTIHEIYRINQFEVHQDFINRKTGDASLVLIADNTPTPLKRLGTYEELQVLAPKLRALHLQLRMTNIGKGIMQ